MELFDHIDMNDNVIGVTDKTTSHAKKLLHRLVAIFVFNKNGELYVQEHKASQGLYDNSVGGHVRQGESYDVAAMREAQEELGLNQPLTFITKVYSSCSISEHMFSLYECAADDNWRFAPNEEVETVIPMKLDDIWTMMIIQPNKFTPDFINVMKEYRKVKGVR